MNIDKKLVCYRKPHRGSCLDEWEVKIVPLAVMEYDFEIKYNSKIYYMLPAHDIHNEIIKLTIGLDPDSAPGDAVRSNNFNALMLSCELFEPAGGWKDHVSWDITFSKSSKGNHD